MRGASLKSGSSLQYPFVFTFAILFEEIWIEAWWANIALRAIFNIDAILIYISLDRSRDIFSRFAPYVVLFRKPTMFSMEDFT